MEPSKQELTLDESIKEVMKTLPPPIRQYLGQGKYLVVANRIMTKYGLHIDQAGVLEREIMFLLMGIDNPDEFTKTLSEEAKIDAKTIGNIVKDVNEQIFMPLREEMRKGSKEEIKPVEIKPPHAPARPPQTLASVPRYVPPKKYFNLQNKIPPPVPTPPIQPVQPQRREVIPVPTETKLLGDHKEPHIEFHKPVVTETPLRQALRAIVPPEDLPGVIQPTPIPEPPPPPLPPKPKPAVPVTPYSADPYREPIE